MNNIVNGSQKAFHEGFINFRLKLMLLPTEIIVRYKNTICNKKYTFSSESTMNIVKYHRL